MLTGDTTNPPNSNASLRASDVLWGPQRYMNSLRQVKYSCDTSSFTLSERPVPSLWSLRLISSPSHRQSTPELCVLLIPLSRVWTASELCRWLAGHNQRILTPYFIQSSILTYRQISLECVYIFNLLTQHILRFPSAGAGSFPFLRDSII